MIGSRCVRGLFSLQPLRQLSSKQGTVSVPYNEERLPVSSKQVTVSVPYNEERLPVKKLEPTQDQGPHYNSSYKQFSSWLNSGGHAEVFEGCHVVGKVIKIYYQVPPDPVISDLMHQKNELLESLSSLTNEHQIQETLPLLMVDWGHKHVGFASLSPDQTVPVQGAHVICKLLAAERAQLAIGHPRYERHNEAVLQYVGTLPATESLKEETEDQ